MNKIIFVMLVIFLVNYGINGQTKPNPQKTTPHKTDPKKNPKADAKTDQPPVIDFPKIEPDPIPTKKGEKWTFSGITATFDEVRTFRPLTRPKKIKVNVLDAAGKPVKDPKTGKYYQKDSTIIEEYAIYAAVKQGEKWGYIDRKGKFLVQPKYYIAKSFSHNYAVVALEQKVKVGEEEESKYVYGVIDDTGKEIVPPKYDNITEVSEDIIDIVDMEKSGLFGYLNVKTGKPITDMKYEGANPFRDGRAAVKRGGKWGFIDNTGKEVIPPTFDDVRDFGEGLARAYKNLKWGFIDKNGKEVISYRYQNPGEATALPFASGMAIVRSGNGEGWIDKNGQFRIQPEYTDTRNFTHKLAAVQKANKWGFIDVTGKLIIPIKFEEVKDFGDVGLAPYREGNVWGFIDVKGTTVIKPIYSEVEGTFVRGMVKVRKGNNSFYIDKTGKEYIN
jgi:hypothetical protein